MNIAVTALSVGTAVTALSVVTAVTLVKKGVVSLTSYFSVDKTLENGYDIPILCATIADNNL